jgi:predicted DNA-binding transcriptional regulator AlpA
MDQEFIQPADAGEITGMSIAALAQLRYRGTGPRYYKPTPRTVLYRRSEVIAWIEGSVHADANSARSFAN